MSLEFNSPAGTLVVRPGDTLVVGLADDDQSEADLRRVKADIEDTLPGVSAVVILGATSMAVYRPRDSTAVETKAVRQAGSPLTYGEDDVESLRAQGVIGPDGKTTLDRIVWQLPSAASGERWLRRTRHCAQP